MGLVFDSELKMAERKDRGEERRGEGLTPVWVNKDTCDKRTGF